MDIKTDEINRKLCLDPTKSFFVSAPAGSGKTSLLVKRFMALLAIANNPEEILAITFTRKAANEMKERLLKSLERAQQVSISNSYNTNELNELASIVLQRDTEKGWKLLESKNRLRIQTIDSFCRSISAQYALETNLSINLESIDNAEPMYSDAAISVLSNIEKKSTHSDELQVILKYLGNDTNLCINLFISLLQTREQWLPYIFNLEMIIDNLSIVICDMANEAIDKLEILLKKNEHLLCKLINFSEENLISGKNEEIIQIPSLGSFPSKKLDRLPIWKKIVAKIITSHGRYRRSLTKNQGFPATFKKEKSEMLDLISWCAEQDNLLENLIEITKLPDTKALVSDKEILIAFSKLLPILVAELNLIFLAEGKCDHTQILIQSLEATSSNENNQISETILHLDHQIKHILIDEYQDTSKSQLRLFQNITSNWTSDNNRTVFCVGDSSQSIYGFRTSTSNEYEVDEKIIFGPIECKKLDLLKNFRSDPQLVNWINRAFNSTDKYKNKKAQILSEEFKSIPTKANDPHSHLSIKGFFGNNCDEEESKQIAKECKKILQNFPEETIAVLVRSKKHAKEIIEQFEKFSVPWEGNDIESLGKKPHVTDMISLSLALTSIADRVAWLSLLRCPMIGFSLKDLMLITSANEKYKSSVITCLIDQFENPSKDISTHGRKTLDRIVPILKTAWDHRRKISFRMCIENTWVALGGPSTVNSNHNLKDIVDFLDRLEEYTDQFLIKVPEFREAVNTLFSSTENSTAASKNDLNKVIIMTIHKSKGLEFDHVFLPKLSKQTLNDEKPLFRWKEISHGTNQNSLIVASREQFASDKNDVFEYLGYLKRKEQFAEEKRLLYVACTRAIKTLHLSVELKITEKDEISPPSKTSLIAAIWPFISKKFIDNNYRLIKTEEKQNIKNDMFFNKPHLQLPAGYDTPYPETFALRSIKDSLTDPVIEDPENLQLKNLGIIFHKLVEQISMLNTNSFSITSDHILSTQIKRISTKLDIQLNNDEKEKLLSAIKTTLSDDKGLWILKNRDYAHSEKKLNYLCTETNYVKSSVIDRTFVHKKQRWIIDYKFSAPAKDESITSFINEQLNRHAKQLEHYIDLFAKIERKNPRAALYFPLIARFAEYDKFAPVKTLKIK